MTKNTFVYFIFGFGKNITLTMSFPKTVQFKFRKFK